ncbi:glycosyltransferase family 4 protein [Fusobacterium sp.]|uniref:glycosyltransferase family 4 protein n=1 Tax=Fusobacterium sp. TaxID=68766 RepID=UPI00396C775B
MKNILFIFLRHSENKDDSTLTKDLADEFFRNGNNITVVTITEKKYNRQTQFKVENGYEVLRVKTGNYFNVNSKIEKAITSLTMIKCLKKEIFNFLGEKKYDLIITHTPFISAHDLIQPLKIYFNCPTFLILWDIFPQNAKDIGMMTNSILFKFFKYKEKKMLLSYDRILCMSPGNVEYMRKNYDYLDKNKIKLLRNWAKIKPIVKIDKSVIRQKYRYGLDDFIIAFGGNMGKPQKLENILKLAEKVRDKEQIKFLFVGSGTEKDSLERLAKKEQLSNVKFLNQVPRADYEVLISACDLGVVSLDERFTVPNFPSKTTDYFKLGLPILASLDRAAAADYGQFLQKEAKGGMFAEAGNVDKLEEVLLKLYDDKELRVTLGKNGRKYYEENLGVEKAYKTIVNEWKTL